MLVLYPLSIHCTAPTGETGTFLKTEEGELASPVFSSLADLDPWANQNGFAWDSRYETKQRYRERYT
jgi:hypothetical protein